MTVFLPASERTEAAGRALAAWVRPGDLLLLEGPLGAGKTTLVRGLARGLGWPEEEPVPSPTFTLLQELPTPRGLLLHADCYRLDAPQQLSATGLLDYLEEAESIVAVEWGERFLDVLGEPDWCLRLTPVSGGRRLALHGRDPARERAAAACLRLLDASSKGC